ncbi:MAG: M48 family metallopeptidase [Silicimonas sp.]|nr:M48 family metallopeptidase [Silicimonas sp.]
MEQFALNGIEILVRRSPRARRFSLRVSSLDGRVTMTVPKSVSMRDAKGFAEQKADWVTRAVSRVHEPVEIKPGARVPVEGVMREIAHHSARSAKVDGQGLLVPVGREVPALVALLKHLARDRLFERVSHHAKALGRDYGRITLRDTRSRWGSCSSQGNLMFSWRLMMATPDVLDYVAAHEVAHLERMDHSPAFWRVVDRLCPDHQAQRKWLREQGNALHRYRLS